MWDILPVYIYLNYLEIWDSSLNNIIRGVDVTQHYPFVSYDTILPYKEILFDNPVNIKGKFYVVLHNMDTLLPGLGHYTGSGSSFLAPAVLGTKLCTPLSVDMYPLLRQRGSLDWRRADFYDYGDKAATMLYLFPILGEYDPNVEEYTGVGIEEVRDISEYVHVFPNPTEEEVNVNCGYKIKKIELYDETGRLLKQEQTNSYNHKLTLTDYQKGVYFIKVFTSQGQTNKKIIKK